MSSARGTTRPDLGAPRGPASGDAGGGSPQDFIQDLRELNDGAEKLEQAREALDKATRGFEKQEEKYNLEMAKLRLEADSSHLEEHKKLPSQERRHDLALTAMKREHPELYSDYFAAKATKEALGVRYRALSAAVSARQTIVKFIGGGYG